MPVFARYTFDDTGAVKLEGQDDLVKLYADPSYQMNSGTLAISFQPDALPADGAATLVSRDGVGQADGRFHVDVLADGSINVVHEAADQGTFTLSTEAGFVAAGDSVSISYSWDQGGTGGYLDVQNTTQGSSYQADVPDTVTMDMGDASRPWTLGAGQSAVATNALVGTDNHFHGSITDFTLSDTVDNMPDADGADSAAIPDMATTDEGTPVTIAVLDDEADPESDPLTVTGAHALNGTVTLNDDGTMTYAPNADFSGSDTITYTITDSDGGIASSTVDVTVLAVNNDPVARDDMGSTGEATPIVIDVLANDVDVDGDSLSILGSPVSAQGSVVVNDDGTLTFTPSDGFTGTATIDYTVSDGNGGEAQATAIVHVGQGPDPVLGRDGIVWGTSGNDLIDANYTGDNDGDVVDGGDAIRPGTYGDDDIIIAGAGDDTIFAGEGNDEVIGGTGNDLIYGGPGNDSIHGDAGDDTIYGGDGDDFVQGSAGNDEIYGGAGNDFLHGGDDNDTVYGDEGDDSVHGGDGDDLLYGGDGNDHLYGGAGNDTLYGGSGNDELYGGDGDDLLYVDGGSMGFGGEGNDTLVSGSGNNYLQGGADRDLFLEVSAGDVIDGGEEGDDYDTIDLRGAGPLRVEYDENNRENGTIHFLDTDGNTVGTATFYNIEHIVPCFTPGTLIATPRGEVLVENLREGDRIITRDNGIQEIRWAGARTLTWGQLQVNPHLKPVLIKQGSLGDGLPERDMMVSPNHRMLVANDRTQLYFDDHEVLVSAKHLVSSQGVRQVDAISTTYLHFMFDRHEVVLANGAWTESFQPGDYTLRGMGNAQRSEIFELFPELKTQEGVDGYVAARRTLRKHEAALLQR